MHPKEGKGGVMQLSGDMETVELDDFKPAFTLDRSAEASVRRRYMTLFVPDDQIPAYGGCGYVVRACNVKKAARSAAPRGLPVS